MSDTDNYKSSLSDEATFRKMKEQEGSGKPGNDSVYSIEQIEAKGGLITNVDRLAGIGENPREEEKKKAAETALAVEQAEMNYQASQINNRISSGTFLKGDNWNSDIELVKAFSQNYFAKFDKDPSSVTREESITAFKAGARLGLEADTPEKREQIANDPYLRRIRNYAMAMEERMLCDPNSKIDPNLSHEDRIKQIEAELIKMPRDKFDALNMVCNKEAKSCELIFKSNEERAEYSLKREVLNKKMVGDYGDELTKLRSLPQPQREEELQKLYNKAISEIAVSDPEGAKLLSEKFSKFSNSELRSKFDAIYNDVFNAINGKDAVTSLSNQDRKDILDEFKASGEISQSTFDKAAKIILPDLQKQYPNLTEADLKAKYASDPEFRKEVSKILEQGVREFDHEHQGTPLNGVSAENKLTFNFGESFGNFFKPQTPAEKMTVAGVTAVSPLAGLALATGNIASNILEKPTETPATPEKSPEAKAAFEGLSEKAKAVVEQIKDSCGCPDKKEPEKTTPPAPEQIIPQTLAQSSAGAPAADPRNLPQSQSNPTNHIG